MSKSMESSDLKLLSCFPAEDAELLEEEEEDDEDDDLDLFRDLDLCFCEGDRVRDEEEVDAGRRPFEGEPDLDEEEAELFSGDPGLDLPLTGELVADDFADDDADTLVDCDLSTLDSLLSNLSDNLGVGDLAGDLVGVFAGELLGDGFVGEDPLEELLSRDH